MAPLATDLDAVEAAVAQAARAAELAAWRADVRGAVSGGDGGAALAALAHDPALADTLGRAAACDDPVATRRAALLAARLERTRLAGSAPWLPAPDGGVRAEAAWLACLREDGDASRREAAWRARVDAARAAGDAIVAAASSRRRVAGYASRVLAAHGLNRAALDALVGAFAVRSEPAWRAAAAARTALVGRALAPWDLYLRPPGAGAAAPPSAWRALVEAVGSLGFAAEALAAVRVDEPAVGGAAATTYFVDPPHDVRVVAEDPGGEWSGWTRLAHELGHALYARHLDPTLPWSLRDAPAPWLHEAVAQLFAQALPPPGAPAAALAFEQVLAARLSLVHVAFERDLLDPDVPLAELTPRWWSAMRRYLGVEDPGGAASWARVSHFARRPGAAAMYLAADAAAAELAPALLAAGGQGASWLRTHLFAPGATRPAAATLAAARAAAVHFRWRGSPPNGMIDG